MEEEEILIENVPMFEKYGFSFNIDLNNPIKERVHLKTVPFSKHTTFNENGSNLMTLTIFRCERNDLFFE
jgi:DNA mismatch repair ATPase MutL